MQPRADEGAPRVQLTGLGHYLVSSGSACTSVLLTNMAETVKTRLQLDGEGAAKGAARQYRGIGHAFSSIYRNEGIRGLQAGLVPAIIYQAVMNGTRLGAYEPLQRAYVKGWQALRSGVSGQSEDAVAFHVADVPTVIRAAAGATSGAIGAAAGSPVFLVKSRLQAQSAFFSTAEARTAYKGMADGLAQIYRADGAKGLFRGINAAVPRVMVGSATQLVTYDGATDLLSGRRAERRRALAAGAAAASSASPTAAPPLPAAAVLSGVPLHITASLISALATVTIMNPLDVVATRLYQSAGHNTQYAGVWDCGAQTVAKEGLGALMKGWQAQMLRLAPHTVLSFVLLEKARAALLQLQPPALTREA